MDHLLAHQLSAQRPKPDPDPTFPGSVFLHARSSSGDCNIEDFIVLELLQIRSRRSPPSLWRQGHFAMMWLNAHHVHSKLAVPTCREPHVDGNVICASEMPFSAGGQLSS